MALSVVQRQDIKELLDLLSCLSVVLVLVISGLHKGKKIVPGAKIEENENQDKHNKHVNLRQEQDEEIATRLDKIIVLVRTTL